MKRTVALCIATLIVFAAMPLAAQSIPVPLARSAALGGAHAALADDVGTVFSNPAGFRLAGPEISFSDVALRVTGPVFSIADLVVRVTEGSDPLALIADPDVQQLLNGLHVATALGGPIAFSYVGNGLGFGFYNTSFVSLDTVGTIPTVTASVEEEVLFAGGYAFRIPLPARMRSTLDVGAELKAFVNGSVGVSKSIIEMLSLLSSASATALLDQPFDLTIGIGIDAGILYQWRKVFSIGIVGRNLYAPTLVNSYPTLSGLIAGDTPTVTLGQRLPIDLSVGIAFTPTLKNLGRYISDLKVMVDYSDILDFLTHPATAANPILHVGLGLEATLMEILALRGGFGDGYFAAGVGLDLSFMRLDVSMYGSELSTEPGMRPAYNMLASLTFAMRPGSRPRVTLPEEPEAASN